MHKTMAACKASWTQNRFESQSLQLGLIVLWQAVNEEKSDPAMDILMLRPLDEAKIYSQNRAHRVEFS
jgi:hypothetical protein